MSAAPAPPPMELERGLPLAAAWALLGVAVRGLCRVRRMVVLGLLYSLPVAMAVLFRALAVPRMEAGDDIPRQFQELEFGLVYVLIPNIFSSPRHLGHKKTEGEWRIKRQENADHRYAGEDNPRKKLLEKSNEGVRDPGTNLAAVLLSKKR